MTEHLQRTEDVALGIERATYLKQDTIRLADEVAHRPEMLRHTRRKSMDGRLLQTQVDSNAIFCGTL
jgi:hypothetical protein